jgi:succinate dehydrogenase/fumarate reductase cytochrome b subunit
MDTQANPSRDWIRIQAISGLAFLTFTVLHLVNTTLGALSPSAYNAFQRALRPLYQHPAIEIGLVLLPLVVHVVAAIARMRTRRGRSAELSARMRVHRYAGYFLMVFIVGHVGATRLPPLLAGAYPEFEGVAFTFQFLPLWFYPYYVLLALSGLFHAAIGLPLALAALSVRVRPELRRGARFWLPVYAFAALVLLGVAGLGGLLYEVPDLSAHPFAQVVLDVTGP